eukprot:gene47498-biopygen34861
MPSTVKRGKGIVSGFDLDRFSSVPPQSAYQAELTGGLSLLDILRLRLGHMSEINIKYAVRNSLYSDCPVTWDQIKDLNLRTCCTCQMGRMKAFKRNRTNDRDRYEPMESIGVDYKGSIATRTVHQNRGFYLFSDHRSNAVWSYPCRLKGEDTLIKILEHFFSMALLYQDFRVKILRCDDDTVENSQLITRYLAGMGIQMHVSSPHVPSQNGQIERAMQTVLDKARTLLIAGGAPRKYWDYAIHMAVYLIMRTPNAKNGQDSTRDPHRSHTHDATFDPKALPCRFLGYDENLGECYKILCVSTQRILDRKDCVFDPSHLYENLTELIDQSYHKQHLIEFENPELEDDHGKLVGDEVAPYFSLDPLEYQMQKERDAEQLYFADECYVRDLVCLVMHAPIVLPTDPKTPEEAMTWPDASLWMAEVEKEFNNLRSHRTIKHAEEQDGPAMKTKLVLKYTYTANYELKRKVRWVVCGYTQRKGVDYGDTFAPT